MPQDVHRAARRALRDPNSINRDMGHPAFKPVTPKNYFSDMDAYLKHKDGAPKIHLDVECVIQGIYSVLSTISGERVRNPLGSTLIKYLFRPVTRTTADGIQQTILKDLSTHEPRVKVQDIRVIPDPDEGTYHVRMEIMIVGLHDTRPLVIDRTLRAFMP